MLQNSTTGRNLYKICIFSIKLPDSTLKQNQFWHNGGGGGALHHWIQSFDDGSHFGLPPSSIHRMTGWVANSRILWRMHTAPIWWWNPAISCAVVIKCTSYQHFMNLASSHFLTTQCSCYAQIPYKTVFCPWWFVNREFPPDVNFGLYKLTLRLWKKMARTQP